MSSEQETLERAYDFTKRMALQLREEFPECIIHVKRTSCADEPDIHFHVMLLNVPMDDDERAYGRAWEIYAEQCPGPFMPYLLDTLNTEQSAEHYPHLLKPAETFEEALDACMEEYGEVLRRLAEQGD